MKTTAYFTEMRKRPDRAAIREEWIADTVQNPEAEVIQNEAEFAVGGGFPSWTIERCALFSWATAKPSTIHFSIADTWTMKAKYFQDTDTLYLELRDTEVVETCDLDQDTILDYDRDGNVVGITIEHARTRTGGPKLELEMISA